MIGELREVEGVFYESSKVGEGREVERESRILVKRKE